MEWRAVPLEGSSVSTCFPSITRLCWSFRIHYSFEDIWELGWPVGVKTQQRIFVIVVLLTMEGGVLRSGPWGLSSLWHSLLRKLSLLLNLTCPIETRVLWEIQEALLRGGEICSPANKIVLRELWAQFSISSSIYSLVKTSVHEGDCIPQSLEAYISPVLWWRIYLLGRYFCLSGVFSGSVMMRSDSAYLC